MLALSRLRYPANLLLRSIQVSFKQQIQRGYRATGHGAPASRASGTGHRPAGHPQGVPLHFM
jgi:hypothetical protein